MLDPSVFDPIEHIRFVEVTTGHWQAVVRNGSALGTLTIEKLGLDLPPITDFYQDHMKNVVDPAITRIRAALRTGDEATAQRVWRDETGALFAPKRPFQALSYDALEAAFPAAERRGWPLTVPRPGNFAPAIPSVDHHNPAHAQLPDHLARSARALGLSAPPDVLRALLISLCTGAGRTLPELAAIVDRQPGTLRGHLRELVHGGALTPVEGRYRAPDTTA